MFKFCLNETILIRFRVQCVSRTCVNTHFEPNRLNIFSNRQNLTVNSYKFSSKIFIMCATHTILLKYRENYGEITCKFCLFEKIFKRFGVQCRSTHMRNTHFSVNRIKIV